MEQNKKNQELIDLSNQYANKVENMQLDEAPIQLNNDESSTWLQGYQLGFQAAIEFLKKQKTAYGFKWEYEKTSTTNI